MKSQVAIQFTKEIFDESLIKEIELNILLLSSCAFCISGNDEMHLLDDIEDSGMTIEQFNIEGTYEKCYDELIDLVGGYNYMIKQNTLPYPLLELIVDKEKSVLLNNNSEYKIYKIQQIKN